MTDSRALRGAPARSIGGKAFGLEWPPVESLDSRSVEYLASDAVGLVANNPGE